MTVMGLTWTKRALVTVSGLGLAVSLTGVPSQAAGGQAGGYYQPPKPYQFSDRFDPECEGLGLTVKVRVRGVDSLRYVKGSGKQAFFLKDRYRFFEKWKDKASGEVLFTWRGRYLLEEYAARRFAKSDVPEHLVPEEGLVGPIYRFKARERGGDVVRDADGSVLYLTRGTVEYRNLFDTLGDRKPGGTSLALRVASVKGPHPLLDRDGCDVAAEQLAKAG